MKGQSEKRGNEFAENVLRL